MKVTGADANFEIVWEKSGIPHVYATTIADAYRGMGYAAGRERLWQIHQSTAYANCEAAALLGERFVAQDAIQRACNVAGRRTGLPDSEGDWIVDAYLQGLNAVVDELDEIPPEFAHAGSTPRRFTRADVAARYRFTSWFQHKTWTEKMALGRLMATHGIEYFRNHILHFTANDESLIHELSTPLKQLSTTPYVLAYPEASEAVLSGSNNWAVTGARSISGKPILATDPHQPHTIPHTFFCIHLSAPGWDVFGAAFPGVPYFMMGVTGDVAWGLTTGFVDCYDLYLERLNEGGEYLSDETWQPVTDQKETIQVKGGQTRDINIRRTHHGPLLEDLCRELGLAADSAPGFGTSLYWSLTDVPTSAGALARLPLAKTAEEFGHLLFEDNICPLVNNIICVDKDNGLRRFIATTIQAREGTSGSIPLPGWQPQYEFPLATAADLTVEIDPEDGFSLTANNDTMGETGAFYIHNFPANSARADRIREHLTQKQQFDTTDFKHMQLDLTDLRAKNLLPDLLEVLSSSKDPKVEQAHDILADWDAIVDKDAAAPCLLYPFLDRLWARQFMRRVLNDPILKAVPIATPGLSRFDIGHFLTKDSPWQAHRDVLRATICETMASVVAHLQESLGNDASKWKWGDLHQIHFTHRLSKHPPWAEMSAGPDPIGGSPTTLDMAMHMGPGPGRAKQGEIPCRVYHGPAFRLIFDLADPEHVEFVMAGGNGGGAGSEFAANQYRTWLNGEYLTISFRRDELDEHTTWRLEP